MSSAEVPRDVWGYVKMIDDFVAQEMSAEEFQRRYMAAFKQQDGLFGSPFFDILNRLFTDADCYVAYPELRTDPEDYDDEQLREKAREARAALTPHLGS